MYVCVCVYWQAPYVMSPWRGPCHYYQRPTSSPPKNRICLNPVIKHYLWACGLGNLVIRAHFPTPHTNRTALWVCRGNSAILTTLQMQVAMQCICPHWIAWYKSTVRSSCSVVLKLQHALLFCDVVRFEPIQSELNRNAVRFLWNSHSTNSVNQDLTR